MKKLTLIATLVAFVLAAGAPPLRPAHKAPDLGRNALLKLAHRW